MLRYLIPLGVFVGLVALFAVGLTLDPRRVPSPLIDKPAPAFAAPRLLEPRETITEEVLQGRVSLVNVWASWCAECRTEHPFLMELARRDEIPIYGLNYKDEPRQAMQWLQRLGNPYAATARDGDGHIGIDWGVYGVPETFVVDRNGVIRWKVIGPLTPRIWEQEVVPVLRRLQRERT